MKLFQANNDSDVQKGVAVRRDEAHRPYVLVGTDLSLDSILQEGSTREIGIRVYLTGALWSQVQKNCKDGDEVVYEADLIAGPDGTFVLGPCRGESESVLVLCEATNSNEINVTAPAVNSRQAVVFNAKTAFVAGEGNLHTNALFIPLKGGEQVIFDWVDRVPKQHIVTVSL